MMFTLFSVITRTQIQSPELLFQHFKKIAVKRDLSLAELIRRGREAYVHTYTESTQGRELWTVPLLRGSGGHLLHPAWVSAEAEAIEYRPPR